MSGKRAFEVLCKAASLDSAVEKLTEAELLNLAEYLSELKPEGGIPAQVFGMVTARLNSAGKHSQEVAR